MFKRALSSLSVVLSAALVLVAAYAVPSHSQAPSVLFGSFSNAAKAVTVTTDGYLNVSAQGGSTPAFTSITTPLVIGGTTASSTLTLESTSGTGTTDAIIFKTGSQVEAARITTGGIFGVGGGTPTFGLFHVIKSVNDFGSVAGRIENTNTGSGAYAAWDITAGSNNIRAYTPSQNVALQEAFFGTNGTLALNFMVGNGAFWQITGGGVACADCGHWVPYTTNLSDIGSATKIVRAVYANAYRLAGVLADSATAPTISAGGCTSPAVTHNNGTAAFLVTLGSSCAGVKTFTLALPAAAHFWACSGENNTSDAAQITNYPVARATSTTAVVVTSYDRVTGLQEDYTAADTYLLHCRAE